MGVSNFVKKMIFARQISFDKGRFEMFGIRGVILPVFTFTKLIEEVYGEKGEKVFDILFEAGKHHGHFGIEEVGRQNKASKREFLEEVIDAGNVMGLGEAEVRNLDMREKKMRITLSDSPFAEQFRDSDVLKSIDHPIDHFQRGVFHAIGEEILESEVISRENKCVFVGDNICEIIIEAKNNG